MPSVTWIGGRYLWCSFDAYRMSAAKTDQWRFTLAGFSCLVAELCVSCSSKVDGVFVIRRHKFLDALTSAINCYCPYRDTSNHGKYILSPCVVASLFLQSRTTVHAGWNGRAFSCWLGRGWSLVCCSMEKCPVLLVFANAPKFRHIVHCTRAIVCHNRDNEYVPQSARNVAFSATLPLQRSFRNGASCGGATLQKCPAAF